jgi:hypothetical protein
MNYKPLIEELRKPQYIGTSDQQAADLINVLTVTVKRLVPVVEVKQWAIEEAVYASIKLGQESLEDDRIRRLCISIVGWIEDASGHVHNADLDKQAAIDMMQGLISFGIATQAQIERLKSLQWITIKWTESVGLPSIEPGHVQSARRMIQNDVA